MIFNEKMINLKKSCREYLVFKYEVDGRPFVGAYRLHMGMSMKQLLSCGNFDETNSFWVSSIRIREARKIGFDFFLPDENFKKYPISPTWEEIDRPKGQCYVCRRHVSMEKAGICVQMHENSTELTSRFKNTFTDEYNRYSQYFRFPPHKNLICFGSNKLSVENYYMRSLLDEPDMVKKYNKTFLHPRRRFTKKNREWE